MKHDELVLIVVLALALILFISPRLRYDLVAMMALVLLVLADVIPSDRAFEGFGHPAVIIVAAVLIVGQGLKAAGVVDLIGHVVERVGTNPTVQVGAVCTLVAVFSAFVSSIAALAVMMPVAMSLARARERSASYLLMPMAFAALLGAMVTLIGSAPNIIISTFRADVSGQAFRMFDYTPVGGVTMVAGLIFLTTVGWRLIPERKSKTPEEELFRVEDYLTEVRILEGSDWVGRRVRDLEEEMEEEVAIVGVVASGEREVRRPVPSRAEILREGDVLILRGDSDQIGALADKGLELVGDEEMSEELLRSDEVVLAEVVIVPGSALLDRTVRHVDLRARYGINLLAVSRRGRRLSARLARIRFKAGDVLLLQGADEMIAEALSELGCFPLAERGVRIGRKNAVLATLLFLAAVGSSSVGLVSVPIAFVAAAGTMILVGVVSPKDAYASIDFSIVVLLGAMIPVGGALVTTGLADRIADGILTVAGSAPVFLTVGAVLVTTMLLSDLVNNAAAAVLMAPIGLAVAEGTSASIDPFLMAVAIGASCGFLTPIAHQTSALVLGPGGYRFGDYWRLGLLLEMAVIIVATPMILKVWPA